jgi:uncharacterized protein (DUF427 family)
VRVTFAGTVIADTSATLTLMEASYPPAYYMSALEKTAHHSHCPYKDEASYFTIQAGGRTADNAVWSYEQPYPALTAIKDHLAFYPNRVDAIEEG